LTRRIYSAAIDADIRRRQPHRGGVGWNLLFFIFNGAAFVLIGLHCAPSSATCPNIRCRCSSAGLAVWLVLVAVRFAWFYAWRSYRGLVSAAAYR